MIAAEVADSILDTIRSRPLFVQIHVGPPGDGTLNRAREFRRLRIRFHSPHGGEMRSGLVRYDKVPADETWTHLSLWDDDRRFVADGHLNPTTVRRGDTIDIENVVVTVTSPP